MALRSKKLAIMAGGELLLLLLFAFGASGLASFLVYALIAEYQITGGFKWFCFLIVAYGLLTGWGFLSYTLIIAAFFFMLCADRRRWRWFCVIIIFIVQFLESWRVYHFLQTK